MYEDHRREVESGGVGFLAGLLCGAAIGAAIGLMFAPKTGSELRQTLSDATGELKKKVHETYGQASEEASNMIGKGREAMQRGREAFDQARQSAGEQVNQVKDRVKDEYSGMRS